MKRTVILMFSWSMIFTMPFTKGAAAQNSTPKASPAIKKVRRTKPEIQNVYSDQWDSGEIKKCATYSGQPTLLVCDGTKMEWEGSLLNLVDKDILANKSTYQYLPQFMVEDKSYHSAFVEALTRSKQFMVEFSDSYGRDPTPWPKPQTGRKMTLWDCSKDKVISCSFGGREE